MRKLLAIGALACSLLGTALLADTVKTVPFLAVLSPQNEVPPTTIQGSAIVLLLVHGVWDSTGALKSGSVDFHLNYKLPAGAMLTGFHIHNGAAGTNGNIVVPTTLSNVTVPASGQDTLNFQVPFGGTSQPAVSVINDIMQNPQNYYVNVHTSDAPGGAMRGQVLRTEMTVLMGLMSPANENPPTNSMASAVATVVAYRGFDASNNVVAGDVDFTVPYTGYPQNTTITGMHIHNGNATVNGPVIINTGISGANPVMTATGAGTLQYEVPLVPTDRAYSDEINTLNGLFTNPNDYYINMHTTVNPGGEIRSQMRTTDSTTFQVDMMPANEVPAVTVTGDAPAAVTVYNLRNADGTVAAGTVIFDLDVRGFPANTTFTGLHIHNGPAGANAGVVIPTDLGSNNVSADANGNVSVYKIVTVADQAGIAALNALVQNPAGDYVNIHSTTNPGGTARAQLSGALGTPSIAGIADAGSTITTAAPGSIIAIYGSNLSGFTSSLNGFYGISQLPTSLNGVTVTVGGIKAPLYFMYSGQINAEVPFEVKTGSVPVVVTTQGGASSSFNLTVADAAPSIFFDNVSGIAAVLKNSDFTAVTADNPAHAGDALLIYSTGLGQTTPTVQTGVLVNPPDPNTAYKTVDVKVTVGGQNAPIIYSIASPNFTGLYQTAITVPNGVSGKVPVVLSIGNAASNTVNINVQ